MVDFLNKYIACLYHTSIDTWPILSLKFYCTNSSWSDLSESNRIHLLLLIRKQKAPFTYWLSLLKNLSNQFESRSGPTERRAWSGSKLLATLMMFLNIFKTVNFEKKINRRQKCLKMLPACQEFNWFLMFRLNYFDAHICSTQRELYWDELLSSGIDSDVWKRGKMSRKSSSIR